MPVNSKFTVVSRQDFLIPQVKALSTQVLVLLYYTSTVSLRSQRFHLFMIFEEFMKIYLLRYGIVIVINTIKYWDDLFETPWDKRRTLSFLISKSLRNPRGSQIRFGPGLRSTKTLLTEHKTKTKSFHFSSSSSLSSLKSLKKKEPKMNQNKASKIKLFEFGL